MSARSVSGREGALRIYDGTTGGTPNYVELKFVSMNLNAPIARARPNEPIVVTVGGAVHSPTGSDYEQALYEPSTISFSLWVNTVDYMPMRAAFSNIDMADPWKVGSTTWQSTKGRGSIIYPDNTYKPTPLFFDQKKKTVDIQARWTGSATSGSIIGNRWDETYFLPQNVTINESADFVEIRASGLVYGNIEPIGDFSFGISSI